MDPIGKRKILYFISGTLTVISLVWLSFFRISWGIDFAGGTLSEWQFKQPIDAKVIEKQLDELKIKDLKVQATGGNGQGIIVKFAGTNSEDYQRVSAKLKGVGESQEVRLESVGPTVGKSFRWKAIWAIGLASLAIILYIAWAFRQVPKPANSWLFGLAAIIALLHDLIISLGLWAILAKIFGWQLDALIIVALLTILGFSVHDTIVVFDRTRENLRRYPWLKYEKVINDSLLQTLTRSINTSLTLILVLTALVIFGGDTIRHFIAILLIGTICGTYSSIFIASPLLVTLLRNKPKI